MKKILIGCLIGIALYAFLRIEFPVKISGTTVKIEAWDSEDYKGRPMLLVSMSTWCPYSKMAVQTLNEVQAKYGDEGLVIMALYQERNREKVRDYLFENNAAFPALYDASRAVRKLKAGQGVPRFVLYDRNHKKAFVMNGYSPEAMRVFDSEIPKVLY
ncbi:Thiol-disulfide isomerase or thioredoxin [Parelusimicrobium proximum]|uniref:TlpA disulfide reductase family protein n=1 Tax=Parelusimicrobium proximum TaxID=3228953 RepID=UPI003D17F77C